ncbi:MAG: tRNA (adenosine(37)-N6)-dimethylallyltransferase MiaA [Microthrixaceae bacterium]
MVDPLTPGRHLVLVGPTASGKSALALALAQRRRASGDRVELISMDSMAVYRGMDIGTTTPDARERALVPHHLIDVVDPDQEFSVAEFARGVRRVLDDLEARDAAAILVGGSGLYVQAVVDDLDLPGRYPEVLAELEREQDTRALHARLADLDPAAAARIEPDNRRRVMRALEVTLGAGRPFSSFGPGLDAYPPTPFVLAGVRVPRDVLAARVERRLHEQLDAGFVDEVRTVRGRAGGMSRTAAQALGYRELAAHLDGECSLDDAVELAITRTRQFGVRQLRWFGRDPRIRWFDHDGDPAVVLDELDRYWGACAAAPDAIPGADEGTGATTVE